MWEDPNKHYQTTYSVLIVSFFTFITPVDVQPTGLHIGAHVHHQTNLIALAYYAIYKTQPLVSLPQPSCTGLRLNDKISTLTKTLIFN